MSTETTKDLEGERPFEERVFARFDAIDGVLKSLDSRVQTLETRAYDTKPIWERALAEILGTRSELAGLATKVAGVENRVTALEQEVSDLRRYIRREVATRLDQIQMVHLENRQDLRDFDKRLDNLESKIA